MVDPDAEVGPQLDTLYWRLTGERPDPSWTTSALALHEDAAALAGDEAAWTTLITVLLRDPRFLTR